MTILLITPAPGKVAASILEKRQHSTWKHFMVKSNETRVGNYKVSKIAQWDLATEIIVVVSS